MNADSSDKEFTRSAGESPEDAFEETSADMNLEAQEETDHPLKITRVANLILLAVLYAIITCFVMISLADGAATTGGFVAFAIVFGTATSTVMVIAIWSAFGERSYFVRYALSHLVGVMMVIAIFVGMLVWMSDGQERVQFVISIFLLAAIPPISLAAQIPFLFLRFVFGWQFVYRQEQASRAFDLRDLFAVIFVFSLGIGAPQIGLTIWRAIYPTGRYFVFFSAEEVLMTYAMVSGLSLFIAIFCVPLLLLVLKTKTLRAGFLFSFVYTIAICFLLEMVVALLDGPEELTTFVAILVPSTSLAIWLPLAAIKIAGFRLTSPKRESANSRRNGTNAQTPPSQEKANDPVHPLDVQDETD